MVALHRESLQSTDSQFFNLEITVQFDLKIYNEFIEIYLVGQ